MRLTGIGADNGIFNAAAINQKVSRLNGDKAAQASPFIQQANMDSVFISGQGKKQSVIQQLMNQKQLIQESKDAELKRGLESGYVNQDKIDEYDEQLEMLDKQIAEATAKQFEEDGEDKESGLISGKKVMTEEEYKAMDGTIKKRLHVHSVKTVEDIRKSNFTIPELKTYQSEYMSQNKNVTYGYDFYPVEVTDDDLPF